MSWLWKESTAVCPSIYVYKKHLDTYTFEERSWRDNEKLREARRVASDKARIYPYINYAADKLLPEVSNTFLLFQAKKFFFLMNKIVE